MNCFVKLRQYPWYMWAYLLGTVLTLTNYAFLKNTYIATFCLFALYCVLFYKGVHILISYKRTEQKGYQSVDKKQFAAKYNPFRVKVLLFWLAFVALCIFGKFVARIEHYYFYSCTYFFLLLDRWFINVKCWLRAFSDTKKQVVQCCCGCPCRGWDLMMIHTPLLFALEYQALFENALIAVSSIIAAVSMICWEKAKYSVVEVKKKCPRPCNLSLCRENRS